MELPEHLCQFPERKLSCFGCCGHHYEKKAEVMDDIRKNTLRWKMLKSFDKMKEAKVLRASGVCFNAVFLEDGMVGCPMHPARNGGVDFREGYCEIDHLCKAEFLWRGWNEDAKRRFLTFVLEKRPDAYDYSMGLDSDSYVDEFIRLESKREPRSRP